MVIRQLDLDVAVADLALHLSRTTATCVLM